MDFKKTTINKIKIDFYFINNALKMGLNVVGGLLSRYGADLIVVGSQGHGAFSRLVLGSVSQYLTTNAKCSVLIARDRNKK